MTYSTPGHYPVWGIESLHWPGPIIITEGIFDAVKVHQLLVPALACLSSDVKHLIPFFNATGRRIIAVCQNDENFAGLKLGLGAHKSICLIKWNDLGEMDCDEVSDLLKYFM